MVLMTLLDPVALLPVVSDLAREAGELMLRYFARPMAMSAKTSRIDIVTEADKEVEELIMGRLAGLFPHHHFVGEESGCRGASAGTAQYHWFIDPIDGTVNYAAGLPHFCTSLALVTAGREPVLGVVYDPCRRELFAAVRGHGATLNGEPLKVTTTEALVDAVLSSGFPYDKHENPDNNLREWAAFLTRIRGERRLGSAALDLAYVAAGRLDGYWEKDLKPYDTLAGLLIVQEAGGRVTDYAGNPRPQRHDRGRYVASNTRLHPAMLEVLASLKP